jgi:hypothetical protein
MENKAERYIKDNKILFNGPSVDELGEEPEYCISIDSAKEAIKISRTEEREIVLNEAIEKIKERQFGVDQERYMGLRIARGVLESMKTKDNGDNKNIG